jgi:carboxypeptidase Taq
MTNATDPVLTSFRKLLKRIKSYEEALGVLYWDLRTGAPRKGMETRSETIGELSAEMFKLSISDEMGEYIAALSEPERFNQLDDLNRKIVEECRKDYERSKKIPPDMYQEYVVLTSQSESVWEEAKPAGDFQRFLPYLERVIDFNQQFIDLWGPKGTRYDTLLDMYEPDMTADELDRLFGKLRETLVPLAADIAQAENKPDTRFLRRSFDVAKQRDFGLFILEQMGYDFNAGRLDESMHPFATGLNPGDVRITTRYLPDDVTSALFGIIHEGGHALYEQNISPELIGTPLATGTSMGIHESQSRFWENMIGRSLPFWQRYYGDLQQRFPELTEPVETFYRAINEVKPSLIRIEADELTYNLHIMIRYEIEKALFNDGLKAAELPEVWNAKYKEYLGIVPSNHGEGVMQDVHWSGGMFGYFPSYSLGNMYAAQFQHTIRRELPEYDDLVRKGELLPIKEWLSERIYQFGKRLTPAEIIKRVTGEPLNPVYLADYLTDKYKEIYSL